MALKFINGTSFLYINFHDRSKCIQITCILPRLNVAELMFKLQQQKNIYMYFCSRIFSRLYRSIVINILGKIKTVHSTRVSYSIKNYYNTVRMAKI